MAQFNSVKVLIEKPYLPWYKRLAFLFTNNISAYYFTSSDARGDLKVYVKFSPFKNEKNGN